MVPPLVVPKNFKHNFSFFNRVPMDLSIVASLNQNVKSIVLVVENLSRGKIGEQ